MTIKKNQVLLIEDDKVDQMAFRRFLKQRGIEYELTIAGSIAEAKEKLSSNKFDIVVSDHFLGDGTAFDIFNLGINTPIVMITGSGDQEIAVKALKSGAYDFLIKDNENNHLKVLPSTIENAIKRKNIEEQLQLIQFSVDNASDSVFWLSAFGKLLFANKATCQELGYTLEELLEMNWIQVAHDFTFDKTQEFIDFLKKNGSGRLELNHRRKDGSVFPVDILANYKTFNDIEYIFIFARDITPRKQMEEKIKRYTDNLEVEVKARTNELIQAEKMGSLGHLVAGVAHEINNPLSFLRTNTEFIQENLEALEKLSGEDGKALFEELKELMETNLEGIDRIATITKTLKRFAKPDKKGKVISNINQGLKDTLIIVHNHLKYRINVHENYGEIPDIVCSIGQINQVFMNLIMNSSQAMDTGDIWIKTWAEDNDVYIQVEDNGKGISGEDVNTIFDPFFTTKPEGTGLGLSLSYKIIQSHGGDIKVESEEGKGTVMKIRLPKEG